MKQAQEKKLGSRYRAPQKLEGRLQIFELKQLADMEAAYKEKCRQAIKAYKNWRIKHEAETDMIELLYGNLEGIMLRRRAEDMVEVYWVIRQDFRGAFKTYLEKSCCYPSYQNQSKTA